MSTVAMLGAVIAALAAGLVLGSFLTARRRIAAEARKQAEAEWAESSSRGGNRRGLAAAAAARPASTNPSMTPSRSAGRPFGPFDGIDDAADDTDETDDTVLSTRPVTPAEDVNPFAGSPAAAPRLAPADTGDADPTPPALPDPPMHLPRPATAESLRPVHPAHEPAPGLGLHAAVHRAGPFAEDTPPADHLHPQSTVDEPTARDERGTATIGWPQQARPAAVGAPSSHAPRPAAEPMAPDQRFHPMADPGGAPGSTPMPAVAPAPAQRVAEPGWVPAAATATQPFEPFAPFADQVAPAPVTYVDPHQVGSADPFRYATSGHVAPEQVTPHHVMPEHGAFGPGEDRRSMFAAAEMPAPVVGHAPAAPAAFAYPDDLYRSSAEITHDATFAAAPAPGGFDPGSYGDPHALHGGPTATETGLDHTHAYGSWPAGADPYAQAHPAHAQPSHVQPSHVQPAPQVEPAYEPAAHAAVPTRTTAGEPAPAQQAHESETYGVQAYEQHGYGQHGYAQHAYDQQAYEPQAYEQHTYVEPAYEQAPYAGAAHGDPGPATYPQPTYAQPAHHEPAYPQTSQPHAGHAAHAYPEHAYPEHAHPEAGYAGTTVAPGGEHLPAHLVVAPTGTPHAPRTAPATTEETREAWRRAFPQADQRDPNGPGAFAPAPGFEAQQAAPALTQQPAANLFHTRPAHLGGPAGFNGGPGEHDGTVGRLPRRRREDLAPAAEEPAPLPALADLPPGYTDPITGLPLADAMRADIELRATDFKQFTVVVCHPMIAAIGSDGTVAAFPKVPVDEEQIRIFAEVLRESLRQRDIVGRYDERLFLLFLARASVSEIRIPMDRIRTNLLHAQRGQTNWVDIAFGAAEGTIGQSVDGPLKAAYTDLLRRNAGPAWFLRP